MYSHADFIVYTCGEAVILLKNGALWSCVAKVFFWLALLTSPYSADIHPLRITSIVFHHVAIATSVFFLP